MHYISKELNSHQIGKLSLTQLYIPLSNTAPASICWPVLKCPPPPEADLVLPGRVMLCLNPIDWTAAQEGAWSGSSGVVQPAAYASCASPGGL